MTLAFGSTNAITPAGTSVDPFKPTPMPNNGSTSPVSSAALTASFSNPPVTTRSAPAVTTSAPAEKQVGKMQSASDQMNADLLNHQNAQSTPPQDNTTPTPDTSSEGDDAISNQIQGLIKGMQGNSGSDTINSEQNVVSEDQSAINDLQDQQNSAADRMNALASGSVPLTATEKAQVDDVAATYSFALADAKKYAEGLVGGQTAANAASGIQKYSPAIAASNLKRAIDSGNERIGKINQQMIDSQSKLTSSLQDGDYKTATAMYSKIGDLIKARKDEISSINTAIDREQTNIRNAQRDQLTALMGLNTMNYQQKQLAISQSTLDERQKADLRNYQLDVLKYQLDKNKEDFAESQGNSSLPTQGLPAVEVTATGNPDTKQQQAFLAQLPPDVAANVKKLASYEIPLSSFPTNVRKGTSGLNQQQMTALAAQYDPTFDDKQYATRAAMQKNVTSGQYSQAITAANTLIQHLSKLKAAADALDNSTGNVGDTSWPFANSIKNRLATAGGNPSVNNFKIEVQAIASEAAKLYKGTGASSEEEIQSWKSAISPNGSPAQKEAAIQTMIELMGGKLSTISQQYSTVMGKPGDFSMLTPQSAQVLRDLGVDPEEIDPNISKAVAADLAPKVQTAISQGHSPEDIVTQLKSDPTIGSKVTAALSQGYTPEEVLEYVQNHAQ